MDFSLEHKVSFPKENILLQERYGSVTWQRCWSTTSILARVEQHHPMAAVPQGPSASSWHYKHLTRQLYRLTHNESSGVIDHEIRGVLQGKIEATRVPFTTRDKEFKSHNRFNLSRFKCSARTSTMS